MAMQQTLSMPTMEAIRQQQTSDAAAGAAGAALNSRAWIRTWRMLLQLQIQGPARTMTAALCWTVGRPGPGWSHGQIQRRQAAGWCRTACGWSVAAKTALSSKQRTAVRWSPCATAATEHCSVSTATAPLCDTHIRWPSSRSRVHHTHLHLTMRPSPLCCVPSSRWTRA
jgi:hypothetical protein